MSAFKFVQELRVPTFSSTEEAMEWGSHLDAEKYAMLIEAQRSVRRAALVEFDLQRMVDLATQSQLMSEAAEAFASA